MKSFVRQLLLCVFLLACGIAHADDGTEVAESQKRLTSAQSLKALGTDLFGESTNFYNGITTFSATDIDLPGNNALPVKISRTRSGEKSEYYTTNSMLADWELDVPYVYGVFADGYPWQVSGSAPNNRCSAGTRPITAGQWSSLTYWRGNFVHIPGGGNQSMTSNLTAFKPTDGQTSMAVTPKYWQVRCSVQLANAGSNGFAGEGFVMLSTDGTKYTFNWMTSRQVTSITKTTAPPPGQTHPGSVALARNEIRIYLTRVDDRFGNSVTYSWSGNRLNQISSSDGRTIALAYNSSNLISTATAVATKPANNKTWTYGYNGNLTSVTLPDGTAWQYSIPGWGFNYGYGAQFAQATCNTPGQWDPATQQQTAHIVHPSGAVGDFTFLLTRHGRTNVDNSCPDPADPQSPYGFKTYGPPLFTDSYALASKQISGPGLTTAVWTAAYAAPQGAAQGETGLPTTTSVTVTNPDQSRTRYTFGIQWYYNEGKLLHTESLAPNGTLLRDLQTTYALNPSNPPYTYNVGGNGTDNFAESVVAPTTQITISDSGTTYTTTVNSFDSMARTLSVTRSNSLGMSRTDSTAYYDNTSKWVLSQVQSQTNTDAGTVVSSTTFDPVTVKPASTTAYGLLQRSVTYNTDGTVASVANALNQSIRFASWKRGAPQGITFPDNATQSAVIDDSGLVTSVTDELNSSTTYGYDGAGRLTSMAWPTGDTVNWTPKTVGYAVLTATELGIPAGSWRMRLNEGAHQKSIYYDAKLNPVLEEEKDTTLNLTRYTRRTYDVMGRVNFEAYPSTSYSSTVGTTTSYDYLGRAVSKQTTDGTTLSQTAYLSGNRLQVTDASGNVTTTSFQAFDKPAYDKPLVITAPQSQTTTYTRNLFGEVLSAVRSGGGASLTETNVYDANHRLCKIIRPESGQHVVAFDAASRMVWSASGTDVGTTSTSSCDYGSVTAAQQTGYSYDSRGRKTLIAYADSSGNISLGYDAAGRLTSVNNPTATWTYTWNKRGLLESQTMAIDGQSFTQDPVYDALGHVASAKPSRTVSASPMPRTPGARTPRSVAMPAISSATRRG